MKRLGLVTIRTDTGEFLKNQLDEVFENAVKVNLYVLNEIAEPVRIEEESVDSTSTDSLNSNFVAKKSDYVIDTSSAFIDYTGDDSPMDSIYDYGAMAFVLIYDSPECTSLRIHQRTRN